MSAVQAEPAAEHDWATSLEVDPRTPGRIRILVSPDAPDNALIAAIHRTVPPGDLQQWLVSPGVERTDGWEEWILERM